MDGSSAYKLLLGQTIPWRDHILYEYHWEWNFPATPTTFAIRNSRYKYIFYHGHWDHNGLYDLETDPMELTKLELPELKDAPFTPSEPKVLKGEESIFSVLKRRDLLLYHVVAGELLAGDVLASDTLTSVQGAPISVQADAVTLNEVVNIIETDIIAENGVIHLIDMVLMPLDEAHSGEDWMFNTVGLDDTRLPSKEKVIGIKDGGEAIAFTRDYVRKVGVVNTRVGEQSIAIAHIPEHDIFVGFNRMRDGEEIEVTEVDVFGNTKDHGTLEPAFIYNGPMWAVWLHYHPDTKLLK